MFFSKNSNYPIGLDISDLSLKLIQLRKAGNTIKVQALSRVSLEAGLIVDGEIKNKDGLIKKIKELISSPKYGKVSSNNIVACLPETKTFIKLIEVEKTPNKLADIIETEIEKYVPFSIGEVYYDWQVIDSGQGQESILIGVIPKAIVNQYTDLFYETKLSIEALEIEQVAICRALLREESPDFKKPYNKNYAIIDFGAARTSLTVYSKNSILFTVSMPISGEKITDEIAKSLEIEKAQAEKAKIICGFDKNVADGIIEKILSATIKELNVKISGALEFYNSHFSDHGPINYIILCGGGASIKGIDEIIKNSVPLEVKRGNILENINIDKEDFNNLFSVDYNLNRNLLRKINKNNYKQKERGNDLLVTQDSSLTYVTAIGLALRGLFIQHIS